MEMNVLLNKAIIKMKSEAYKALVEIKQILSEADLFVKNGYKLPPGMILQLNKLGELGRSIKAYTMTTNDRTIIEEVGKIPRFELHSIFSWYDIPQETRISLQSCIRTLYDVARISNKDKEKEEEPPRYSKDEEEKATRQFNNLVKGGYFPSETLLDDWLYIYGVQGKSPNKKPLDWQKTQKELAYMITRIWQNTDTRKWAIGEKVFTIKGKKPNIKVMKSDLSSIDNDYKNRPRTFDALDEVLKA